MMKLQRTILLRVDASPKLGLGHLMRCIALAQGLEKESVRPFFIIKEAKEARIITDYGFDSQTISQKTSFQEDVLKTMRIAAQFDAHIIIVDLSHYFDMADRVNFEEHFQMLKKHGAAVIVLDDYDKINIAADIHVIPYYGADTMNYSFPRTTKPLLGLDYFIFRQEFSECVTMPRTVRTQARNVLISMGGSDPANVTEKILESLAEIQSPSLDVKVVLGRGFTSQRHQAVISRMEKLNRMQRSWSVIEDTKNMAELMLWSDVAIISGGLIKYETALTGSPTIIISQKELEAKRCEEYAQKTNAAIHLGHFKNLKANIGKAALDLLNDYTARRLMSEKGKNLVDGKGTQRVIKHILEMETALV